MPIKLKFLFKQDNEKERLINDEDNEHKSYEAIKSIKSKSNSNKCDLCIKYDNYINQTYSKDRQESSK